jgi:6-phosphogluconolactonase (cycloisomerase 2 family)
VKQRGRTFLVAVSMPVMAVVAVFGSSSSAAAGPTGGGPRVLYVTNWLTNDVSTLRVDRSGFLVGPPVLTPVPHGAANPLAAVQTPTGWLYVSNWGSGGVSAFRIGGDGALSAMAAVPAADPAPTDSAGVALDWAHRQLFVANFNDNHPGTLSRFDVQGGIPRAISTVDTHGNGSAGLALSPDGRLLIVANMGSGDVSLFAIDSDGTPTFVRTVPTGAGAFYPAFSPDGQVVLVANASADTVTTLRRTGRATRPGLSVIGSYSSRGSGPRGIAVAEDGAVYVAHYAKGTGPGTVTAFQLDRSGGLKRVGPAVATGSNAAEAIVVDSSGRRLYVANFNTGGPGSISTFAVGRGGSLQLLGPPTPTGGREPDFGDGAGWWFAVTQLLEFALASERHPLSAGSR